MTQPLSKSAIDEVHQTQLDTLLGHARQSLLAFTKATFPGFRINWHHRVLCRQLDKFARGETTRLMVFMPPQIGKTELVSRRLPAFLFGRDPDEQIIGCSYAHNYAKLINRDVQRVIDSDSYRRVFPDVRLSGEEDIEAKGHWMRNTDVFEVVGRRGRYHCAGVGGSLTGKTANTLIIDDPVKNWEDASSETFRQAQFDWYVSTAQTRLLNRDDRPARVLVTATRWHEDDLMGRLTQIARKDKAADQWTVVCFPAIREDDRDKEDPRQIGEALWPSVFSLDRLLALKASSSRTFIALYQQRPSPEEGEVVKRGWWKYYREAPVCDRVVQSWDLTFKKGASTDFVVGSVWGQKGSNRFLLDQVRARMGFTETIQAIKAVSAKWPEAGEVLIEDAANGAAAIDTLKDEISGVIPIRPLGAKEFRAQAIAPQIEAGNVHLPEGAPWLNDYLEEWAAFPNGAHDDQVDSTTQALLRMRSQTTFDWAPISVVGQSKWLR